jgi:hypothetical protein
VTARSYIQKETLGSGKLGRFDAQGSNSKQKTYFAAAPLSVFARESVINNNK